MQKIAFIGLGNMGLPMAINLQKAGFNITGFDLSSDVITRATGSGMTCAPSLSTALQDADVMITMLPKGTHVVATYEAAIPNLKPSACVIDCSTIDIESSAICHGLASNKGIASLDAPVSGGITGAANASLTFMVGGDAATFEAIKPILTAMGKNIIHCGAATAGQAAKICNNMILGISMIAVSEAFVLGEKLGLSHQALYDVASTSSGQCWSLTSYCPVPGPVQAAPSNRNYAPGFAVELMEKDLSLAQGAAASVNASTPLGAHAASLYHEFLNEGGEGRDFSSIIEWLRAAED